MSSTRDSDFFPSDDTECHTSKCKRSSKLRPPDYDDVEMGQMGGITENPSRSSHRKSRRKSKNHGIEKGEKNKSRRSSHQPRRGSQQQETGKISQQQKSRRSSKQQQPQISQQQKTRRSSQQQQPQSSQPQQPRGSQQTKPEDVVVYRAYLSYVIMVVNAILFIWMMSTVDWEFQSIGANQMYGPKPSTLLACGGKLTSYIVSGQWWRLFTASHQHAGLIHLAMTEILLWRMGQDIETQIGHLRFGVIYFSSSLFGVMLSAIFIPNVTSVGASGAIFGCIGAQLGEWFHYGHLFRNKYRTLASIIIGGMIGISIGLVPNIDNYFHIGGWFCGVFASIWVYYGALKQHPSNPKGKLYSLGALGVLIVAFIVAFGVIMSGTDAHEWCSGCKYLNCVNSPLWNCSYNDCYNAETQAQESCV